LKLKRSGRHATPSQVEKVAEKAGKAAPAMAISAGVLMAAPHGHDATAAKHTTVAENVVTTTSQHAATAHLDSAVRPAQQGKSDYTVKSGDTLSTIASQAYGKAGDWQWLYHENGSALHDPNLIYPGQVLKVPSDPPANYTLPASEMPATSAPAAAAPSSGSSGYQPQHAAPATQSGGSQAVNAPAMVANVAQAATTAAGTYSCSGLESLWEQAGGSAGEAVMAASIAMAESGGNPNAVSPTNDYGLWQINGSHGALATLNPLGNAQAAVSVSGDGSGWGAWTTFTSGAYSGRC
jgi:LysM repeat protein